MTEWRAVPDYEGLYQVSDTGSVVSMPRVVDHPRGQLTIKQRKLSQQKGEYLGVTLSRGGKQIKYRVHVLVCTVFHGERPDGHEVCHNNGDHYDNRASNLRWGTRAENSTDTVDHGHNVNKNKTYCKQGHEFTEENTRVMHTAGRRNPWRQCKTCSARWKTEWEARK